MTNHRVITEFRVQSASEMAEKLEAAVTAAEREAYANRTSGVLVIRHDFNRFSVALSTAVPYGITQEHDFALL